jgi:16S rRNA (guanine(966)-N(2))-methyltransferase RsmD
MRVIAGALKGRRLKAPTWEGLRPTSDKLRETLFNILSPRIVGARLLDGYAGTGAIGIEALSRGAGHVVFVEHDRRAQALIAENLAHCGIADSYAIIRRDVLGAFASFSTQPPFDIIVLDPPYAARDNTADVLAGAGELLSPNGVLILEHARRTITPESAGRLVRTRDLRSGDSALAFYERPE